MLNNKFLETTFNENFNIISYNNLFKQIITTVKNTSFRISTLMQTRFPTITYSIDTGSVIVIATLPTSRFLRFVFTIIKMILLFHLHNNRQIFKHHPHKYDVK